MDTKTEKQKLDQLRATYTKKYWNYCVEIAKSYEKTIKKLRKIYGIKDDGTI